MSTANFYTQKHFDLWACDDSLFCETDDEGEEFYSNLLYLDWSGELERELDDFNDSLTFYRLTIEPGYYVGAQILVQSVHENGYASLADWMPENLDNSECWYYWDMNRSTAIRRHKSEVNKINRYMAKNMPSWGLQHLVLGGRFSNGEAIYYPADTLKAATL